MFFHQVGWTAPLHLKQWHLQIAGVEHARRQMRVDFIAGGCLQFKGSDVRAIDAWRFSAPQADTLVEFDVRDVAAIIIRGRR